MKRHLSIGHLLAIVASCGIALASWRDANEVWAKAAFSSALLVLASSCPGAAYRRGPSRAAWVGFAWFGWGYLVLAFGPWFVEEVRPHLLTTWILNNLPLPPSGIGILKCPDDLATLPGPGNLSYSVSGFRRWNSSATPLPASWMSDRERIGHSIFSLLAGLVGGVVVRRSREAGIFHGVQHS